MNINEIIVWNSAGLKLASYPKNHKIKLVTPFFTAIRQFSHTNGYGDPQVLTWMYYKILFRHDKNKGMSFAIIADVQAEDKTMWTFLDFVRDEFILSLDPDLKDGDHDTVMIELHEGDDHEQKEKYDGLLKDIVDRLIGEITDTKAIKEQIMICDS